MGGGGGGPARSARSGGYLCREGAVQGAVVYVRQMLMPTGCPWLTNTLRFWSCRVFASSHWTGTPAACWHAGQPAETIEQVGS